MPIREAVNTNLIQQTILASNLFYFIDFESMMFISKTCNIPDNTNNTQVVDVESHCCGVLKRCNI